MDTNKQIICVKIAQRRLYKKEHGIEYFPFDRVYLCSSANLQKLKDTFRYLLYFPVEGHKQIINALTELRVQEYKRIDLERKPPQKVDRRHVKYHFFDYVGIPTTVRTKRDKPTQWKDKLIQRAGIPEGSFLTYKQSRILNQSLNTKAPHLEITLKTPRREIQLICAACSNALGFHSDECRVGCGSCVNSAQINLPYDNHQTPDYLLELEASHERRLSED